MRTYHALTALCVTLAHAGLACDALADGRSIAQRPGYVRQAGGNASQQSRLEYDRGGRHHSQVVRPGSTVHIPADARNIQVNGLQVAPGSRVTVSPQGSMLLDD